MLAEQDAQIEHAGGVEAEVLDDRLINSDRQRWRLVRREQRGPLGSQLQKKRVAAIAAVPAIDQDRGILVDDDRGLLRDRRLVPFCRLIWGRKTEAPAGKIHVPGFSGDLSAACRGAGVSAFSSARRIALVAVNVGISHLSLWGSTEAFRWRSCGGGVGAGDVRRPQLATARV